MANPSEPKILPAFNVWNKFFCQEDHPGESASNEKTPILMWGAKASLRAFEYPILDFTACLKFCDLTIASFLNGWKSK